MQVQESEVTVPAELKSPGTVHQVDLRNKTTTVDLGTTLPGSTIEVRLEISNSTAESVEINEANLSCGCLELETGSKNVAVNEKTFMLLKVAVPLTSGFFHQTVSLKLGKPTKPAQSSIHVIEIKYRSARNCELVPQAQRWTVGVNSADDETFALELLGNHGFDISEVKVTANSADVKLLRSVPLTLQGSATSRTLVTALFVDDKVTKAPRVIEFTAKTVGEDDILAVARVAIFRAQAVEVMPSFVFMKSDSTATLYAKFATPPKMKPEISIGFNATRDLLVTERYVSPTLVELKIAIPAEDFKADQTAVVRIKSDSGQREFAVPVKSRASITQKAG